VLDPRTPDALWLRIRTEALQIAQREPQLTAFVEGSVLRHDTLDGPELSAQSICDACARVLNAGAHA
jgi:hypothetical protein